MESQFHVKAKSAWKSVDISQAGLSQKDLDGFISFEELTDYEIITPGKKNGKKEKKNETKNVKVKEVEEASGNDSPRKKKKRRKKKNVDKKTSEENTSTISETSPKENKQKQKKNKKLNKPTKVIPNNKQSIEDINETLENERKVEDTGTKVVTQNKDKRKRKSQDPPSESSPKKKSKHDPEKVTAKHVNKSLKGMDAWKDLYVPDEVLWALRDAGFQHPTPIQNQILPSAIRDKMDVVGAAETGSGKTLAFGIPVIHFILQHKKREAERLLRELNKDNDDGDDDDNDTSDNEPMNEEAEIEDITDLVENTDNDNTKDTDDDDGEEDDDDDNDKNDDDDNDSDDDDEISELEWESDNDKDDDDDNNNDDNNDVSSDEELEDIQEDGRGCVKVIKDIEFDWLKEPDSDIKPLLSRPQKTHPHTLILQPTRELAIQVKNHLLNAAKYTDVSVAAIVGGLALPKQQRVLKKCPDILVATPGRLWELIQQGEVFLSEIEKTNILVVDEADRMIEKGHFEELSKLLEKMKREPNRENRHTYVFSATLTLIHSGPQRIMKKKKNKLDEKQKLSFLMRKMGLKEKPKIVDLTRKVGTVDSLTEARIHCTKEEKDIYLYYFLKHYPGRTLVFANSKDCIRRLVSIFTLLQCNPLPLHADMHQRQRLKNLDRFTSNPNALLMASDVAARGLDIPNVQHVIHYQVPLTVENYVHRSGRTARASKEGLSVMIVGHDDSKNYKKIMHTLNKSDDLPAFPVEQQALTELRRRVNMVRKIETQDYRFNKSKRHNDWFTKAAEEIGVDIDDEGLLDDIGTDVEQARHRQYIKQMKAELSLMLKQPLQMNTIMTKYPTKTGKLVTPTSNETLGDAMSNVKKSKKVTSELVEKTSSKKDMSWNERWRERRKKKAAKKAAALFN